MANCHFQLAAFRGHGVTAVKKRPRYFLSLLTRERMEKEVPQAVPILRDVSFLLSMLHVMILFLLLYEPRLPWRTALTVSFAGWAAVLAGNACLMLWKGPSIIMRAAFFTCTIPSALLFFALSKYRDGRFFFLFCLTDTVSFWLLQITNFLDRMAGDTYVVMLVTRLILFPLVEWLFWRYLRRPYLELQRKLDKSWWLFAAMGAVYYLLIMTTSVPVGMPMPDAVGLARIILVLILMPLTYFTILRALWQQMSESQARTELEILSTRSRLALDNLRILQESGAALAQARHDILGNLGILQSLSRQGEYAKLDEYLDRITQQTREIVPLKITAHPIVNAILAQGAERAKKSGVEFRCQVDLPDTLSVPDVDLTAFLMNLMNNALDAAGESPQQRPRWVEITMHIRGKYLFIEERNTYAWAPEPGEDGERYLSHKGAGHGYGLKIMEDVARRYQSELHTEAEDGVFLARTALLMP